MTPRSKWLTARKKVFVSCLIAAIIYFIITFVLIHFNVLSSRELISGTSSPSPAIHKGIVGKLNYKTTTTTTPTPFIFFTSVNNLTPKVVIEKFDAMKVHADIMKRKIIRMTEKHPNKQNSPLFTGENLVNNTVHMFYSNSFYTGNKKEKVNWRLKNTNATYKIIKQNLDTARRAGAGVILVTCSRLSNSLISQTSRVHSTLKLLFHLGPKYGLKIGIAIKDYTKRNVMSVRRDIRIFTSMYGKEKALYRIKRDKQLQTVVYVLGSFTIASDEWSEVLSLKGKFTIRNTKIDAVILGELQDEEQSSHIRLSHFDGFFTPGSPNGDVFGSTWKNWQALATWSQEKGLFWSAGVVEVSSGLPAVGVALRTALRCHPRPNFMSFTNVPINEEYFTLTQTWLRKWSNSSISESNI